jgi:excisionase family DNA binding protein
MHDNPEVKAKIVYVAMHGVSGLSRGGAMLEPYIDIKELEKLTKLPRSWLYAQAAGGHLPHYKCGKYLRFKISEIEQWLARQRRGN